MRQTQTPRKKVGIAEGLNLLTLPEAPYCFHLVILGYLATLAGLGPRFHLGDDCVEACIGSHPFGALLDRRT
jgi:hypothetical protein